MANKLERKYFAHFLDIAFSNGQDATSDTPEYFRLGKDLQEYSVALNPDVNVIKNILGETSVTHSGYQPQGDVGTYYAYDGDKLFEKLSKIGNERRTGDSCLSTVVDVMMDSTGKVEWAYREDCYVVPESVGGDTSGVQIPFSIYYCGNRTEGTFDLATKEFTAS